MNAPTKVETAEKMCYNHQVKPSSYILFARKVKGSGWTKRMIWRKFDREVEKDDYAKTERFALLDNLYTLSTKFQ